jgi:hypothetical protein
MTIYEYRQHLAFHLKTYDYAHDATLIKRMQHHIENMAKQFHADSKVYIYRTEIGSIAVNTSYPNNKTGKLECIFVKVYPIKIVFEN